MTRIHYSIAAALLLLAGSVHAQSVEEFYRGKTVTVVSPSSPGGSIYQYALLVSNHIGRHIPGQPSVVAEARRGGGGVKAANYLATAAPKNGLVIAEIHPSSLVVPLMRDVKYDPREFHWLGSVAVRSYVGALWHDVPVDTLEEMRDREVIFGGSGTGSASYQYPTFLAHVTGARLKVITGYKSGGATNLALERGEVQGRGNYYEGFMVTNPDWLRDRKVKFAFRLGPDHPDLADVPTAASYMKTDEERQMLRVLEAPLQVGQAFYVAGEVPPERVAALREAFRAMLEDPAFRADAEKQRIAINPRTHEHIERVIADVFTTPGEVVARLGEILKR